MSSITELFNQLLEAHVNRELLRPHLDPLNTTLVKHRKALRATLYSTLFAHLDGPLQQGDAAAACSSLAGASSIQDLDNEIGNQAAACGVKEHLLQIIFDIRCGRDYDRAHRLERLVSSLPDMNNGHHTEMKAAIQLLLVLAGTGRNQHKKPPVGHREPDLPLVSPENKDDRGVVLSGGPRYHGDSCHVYHQGYQGYIHYSRDLFEGQQSLLAGQHGDPSEGGKYRMLDSKLFEVEPGRDLLGDGLFSLRGLLDSQHERTTRETLFNGLTHSKTRQLNVKLDLPELPDTANPSLLGLHIPSPSEPSEDEGFHEASSASTPASETSSVRQHDENIWQKALRYQPNRHYTWETIGCIPRATERPYLTEAGSEVFDEMYRLRCQEASVLDASLQRPLEVLPDQVRLVRDSIHVLLSVPSLTFRLDKEADCFLINPDLCLTGTTPGSFHQLLAELAQAGTDHHRLTAFSQQRVLDSTYTGGLVLQAFTSGIRRFLQYYRAIVQRATYHNDGRLTVMTLKAMFGKIIQQIRYLADLCDCSRRRTAKPGDPGDGFPLGIKLLSYLYQEALDCSLQDRYQLVLSLLRSSCGPYLMFIQDWVFHGTCRDVYGEFLMSVSDEYLHYRDKHYWTQGFVLKSDNAEESVPLFLKDLAYDIYVCGKSLNLMRLCCPEHFLCNPEVAIPRISLTFSAEELDNSARSTGVYVGHMQVLARQKTVSRQEKELQESEAKHELISQARKAASEELKRLQDAIQEQKAAEDAKKREEFKLLKDQMHRDLVRRALVEESERQEDIDRMDALTKREEDEARDQYDLEQRVREEVIEYYAKLSEEAAARERKALWRIRRHQLDDARLKFLVTEELRIRQELDDQSLPTPVRVDETDVPAGSEVMKGRLGEEVSSAVAEQREAGESQYRGSLTGLESRGLPLDKTDGPPHIQSPVSSELLPPQVTTQQGSSKREGAMQPRPPPEEQVAVGSDVSGVGNLPNDDIESTLQMISQGSVEGGPSGRDVARAAPQPEAQVVFIGDFLPKVHAEDDGLEMASSNDADVDDILVQIGSTLPSEAPANEVSSQPPPSSDVIQDMLGLSEMKGASRTDPAHPSDSVLGSVLYPPPATAEQSALPSLSSGEHPVGHESAHESKRLAKSSLGHAQDSSLGDVLYPREPQPQLGRNSTDQNRNLPSRPHPSDSTVSLYPTATATEGQSISSAPETRLSDSKGGHQHESKGERVKPRSAYGHAGDSSVGALLYPSERSDEVAAKLEKIKKSFAQLESGEGGAALKPLLPHASDSTIQSMLYPDQGLTEAGRGSPVESSHYVVASRPHGHHPSDSTAQNVMYGRREVTRKEATEADGRTSKEEQSIAPWTGQGVEPFQDNFDALDKPPMPDLLSNIGYIPLSAEIGDYGLQAAESESTDAVELQSLPIIMKRSVTAPLLAQIGLVNQSILDYFMVELGIGKHFEAIRSFLFLEDGEFGQSLCDQLFDKVAQGMLPNELLTPIILNPLLARAVQNSASRESEYANNLGFSLKYLPHIFKPNAIDTFDCLELRYRVDWPCNIVITDTCLAKYNRVFSFLLQLKRISWVLRDIFFQLKRGALVSHAANSPQFRQLQLFRHEMQHFVNVMQGYVVNQIIHVTWEEFQRHLKTEVHNLDDLHQKHAEYLNKAIFRCLLNKKAAPVMKIISDILCLILKVRTQLVSMPWDYDQKTGQATHPGFHTIKMSYLAFKDYSEFLYKVVAKLVTRGYQPHLEEFMLRLNFNDFYQET